MGHVGAEHPPQQVELVDDDVAQPHEEGGPPRVVREDAVVQHLGVGEQHVGVGADPGALLGPGVTVVGGGDEPGDLERRQPPELVLGQGLGREEQQRRCRPHRAADRLGDGHLVAERLARGGARGDGHRPARPGQVDGRGLVAPQPVERQPAAEVVGERHREVGEPGRAGRQVLEVHHAAVERERGEQVVELGCGGERHGGPRIDNDWEHRCGRHDSGWDARVGDRGGTPAAPTV
jgi:hypothetical protein